MEMIKTNNIVERLKEGPLRDYAKLLIDNGFRLLIYKSRESGAPVTWFHFEKDNKIGYCQESYFGGLRFSSVHKPSKEAGTGYGLSGEFDSICNPTIEHAQEAMNLLKPFWANDVNFMPKKYKSLEEYMERETILKYDIVEK